MKLRMLVRTIIEKAERERETGESKEKRRGLKLFSVAKLFKLTKG